MPNESESQCKTIESECNVPFELFNNWLEEAKSNKKIRVPNAACLATCSDGDSPRPSCRIMSIEDFNKDGFLFFTSYNSKKAHDLDANPQACCCFYWDAMSRQVCINGTVRKISREEAETHFSNKPFGSRVSFFISDQAKKLKNKQEFLEMHSKVSKQFEKDQNVPTPENWGGYMFIPAEYEFYESVGDVLEYHLINRVTFRKPKQNEDVSKMHVTEGGWIVESLAS